MREYQVLYAWMLCVKWVNMELRKRFLAECAKLPTKCVGLTFEATQDRVKAGTLAQRGLYKELVEWGESERPIPK